MILIFVSDNKENLDISSASINLGKFFFAWAIQFESWLSEYLDQRNCFPTLYFSALIRTKIEYINKQLLLDVNWPNKGIWKSALSKAIKYVLLFEKPFLKTWVKNISRKHKTLLFFTVADWGTMDRVVT